MCLLSLSPAELLVQSVKKPNILISQLIFPENDAVSSKMKHRKHSEYYSFSSMLNDNRYIFEERKLLLKAFLCKEDLSG